MSTQLHEAPARGGTATAAGDGGGGGGGGGDAGRERQVVALHLAGEIYGIDIEHIHTVITPQAITQVPKAPPFVQGVMNLRGRILPVIDLRARFGLPPLPADKKQGLRIVIVDVEGLAAGLIVDAVSEVLRLSQDAIDPPSRLVASADTECITGIGHIPDHNRRSTDRGDGGNGDGAAGQHRLIILLDVYKTLTSGPQDAQELKALHQEAAAVAAAA